MFTISRASLLAELQALKPATSTAHPILGCVLMSFNGTVLTLTTTDYNVTLTGKIPAEGKGWSGCVPLSQLLSLVKLLGSETIDIIPTQGRVGITSGEGSKHVLCALPADDWPMTPSVKCEWEGELDGEILRRQLALVLPSIGAEDSKFGCAGVQMEAANGVLNLVATDNHRIAIATMSCKGEFKVLVPTAGAQTLARMAGSTIFVKADDRNVEFQGDRKLTVRLMITPFPNWQSVVPVEPPLRMQVDAEALGLAVRRVLVTRGERKTDIGKDRDGIKLTFNADSITIETKENDKGKSSETVAITSNLNGDTYPVGLNADYLLDFLSHVKGEIAWEMKDGKGQQLLSQVGLDFKYVIVPRRL